MHPSLHVKQHQRFNQQPRKSLITKRDVRNRSMIVVRESVQHFVFSFTAKRCFSTISVSNFTSATFSVVKKYTQLACNVVSKISHRKSTLKFACKKSACKCLCKNLYASFLRAFFVEIRHIARNLRACKCCNARGLYCRASVFQYRSNCTKATWISLIRHLVTFSWTKYNIMDYTLAPLKRSI